MVKNEPIWKDTIAIETKVIYDKSNCAQVSVYDGRMIIHRGIAVRMIDHRATRNKRKEVRT